MGAAILARACDACAQGTLESASLHRRETSNVAVARQASVARPVVQELRAPGQPLAASARGFLGSRFGHSFGAVRVHRDAQTAQSAQAVNAVAYTVGSHIVFGADCYRSEETVGRGLLAHELSHVVQQSPPGALIAAAGGLA